MHHLLWLSRSLKFLTCQVWSDVTQEAQSIQQLLWLNRWEIPRRNMLIFVGLQHLGMHLFCFVGLFGFFAGLKKGRTLQNSKFKSWISDKLCRKFWIYMSFFFFFSDISYFLQIWVGFVWKWDLPMYHL